MSAPFNNDESSSVDQNLSSCTNDLHWDEMSNLEKWEWICSEHEERVMANHQFFGNSPYKVGQRPYNLGVLPVYKEGRRFRVNRLANTREIAKFNMLSALKNPRGNY